jgi:hypothetical protein
MSPATGSFAGRIQIIQIFVLPSIGSEIPTGRPDRRVRVRSVRRGSATVRDERIRSDFVQIRHSENLRVIGSTACLGPNMPSPQ